MNDSVAYETIYTGAENLKLIYSSSTYDYDIFYEFIEEYDYID